MDFDVQPDGRILIDQKSYDLENETLMLIGVTLLITKVLEDAELPKILQEQSGGC